MNEKFKNKYRIGSARLKNWDYANTGYYFVTICVKNRKCVFGDVINGDMRLNEVGNKVFQFWENIPIHFKNIEIDEFIIMPNHVHGIVVIEAKQIDTRHGAYVQKFGGLKKQSLSLIINHFKGSVTRWCKKNERNDFQWQSRFYDHIIRNEKGLENIQKYIHFNPAKWSFDKENPSFIKK